MEPYETVKADYVSEEGKMGLFKRSDVEDANG